MFGSPICFIKEKFCLRSQKEFDLVEKCCDLKRETLLLLLKKKKKKEQGFFKFNMRMYFLNIWVFFLTYIQMSFLNLWIYFIWMSFLNPWDFISYLRTPVPITWIFLTKGPREPTLLKIDSFSPPSIYDLSNMWTSFVVKKLICKNCCSIRK